MPIAGLRCTGLYDHCKLCVWDNISSKPYSCFSSEDKVKTMPEVTRGVLINLVKVSRFPNGVMFRATESFETGALVFFCQDCEKVGYRWNYSVMAETIRVVMVKEHLLSALYKHAELHNPLCKRLEQLLLDRNPVIYQGNDLFYELEEEEKPKRPKPRRMIRLR